METEKKLEQQGLRPRKAKGSRVHRHPRNKGEWIVPPAPTINFRRPSPHRMEGLGAQDRRADREAAKGSNEHGLPRMPR